MITAKSEFFDPELCEFEVHGFYEELIDPVTGYWHGHRRVDKPSRPLGSDGRIELSLTERTVLRKGVKEVVIKASPKHPVRVFAMFQAVCGRVKGR